MLMGRGCWGSSMREVSLSESNCSFSIINEYFILLTIYIIPNTSIEKSYLVNKTIQMRFTNLVGIIKYFLSISFFISLIYRLPPLMQQQFYLYSDVLKAGSRKSVSSINIDNQPMICLCRDNQIQFYDYAAKGIAFKHSIPLFAHISHLKVLPSRHQSSDFLFVLDEKGRFAFCSFLGGFQLIYNGKVESQDNNLFKSNSREGEDCHFCSCGYSFDVLDTKGFVYFNLGQDLVILEFTINSSGLMEERRIIELNFVKFRHLQSLEHSRYNLIGLVVEEEEKTFFNVYNLEKITNKITTTNHFESFPKINLLEFIPTQSNQVLLLTSDQLILAKVHPFTVVSRFQVHNSIEGKLVKLGPQLYGFIGSELILVNETIIKSYGSLQMQGINIIQNKGVLEVSFLRDLQSGAKLISIVTNYNEVYFVVLYQNTWKCIKKLASIGPIFSVFPSANPHSFIAVTNTSNNGYDVVLVEREIQSQLSKEEDYPFFIQKLYSLREGQNILVCSKEGNHLLSFIPESKQYQTTQGCLLPAELIIANDNYYVTSSCLYVFDQSGKGLIPIQETQIALVALKDRCAVFQNSQKEVFEVNLETHQTQKIRTVHSNQYSWVILHDLSLIVASSEDLTLLTRYQKDHVVQRFSIQDKGLISAMIQFPESNFLVLGYVSGLITLLNLTTEDVQHFQCFGYDVISFFDLGPNRLGVLSGDRQFIMTCNEDIFHLQQVQLSYNYQKIHSIVCSKKANSLIFPEMKVQGSVLMTVDLQTVLPSAQRRLLPHQYRMTRLFQAEGDIPVVHREGSLLFIGIKQKVVIISLSSLKRVKELDNFLKDVIGMQKMGQKLLVYGVDQLKRNILMLISIEELEVTSSINLILKDNKYIKEIKIINSSSGNTFLCRGQKYTTQYELSDNLEPIEIAELKVDYQGYSLDLSQEQPLFAMTDSYRFIAVYTYHPAIIPVTRYVAPSEVNDLALLHRSILFADKKGELSLLQYNFEDQNEPLRMLMTKVGSIKIAEEISTITRINATTTCIGTVEGKVGSLTIVPEGMYELLKSIEEEVYNSLSKKEGFDYKGWRDRVPSEDKLIDSVLIEHYLTSTSPDFQSNSQYEALLSLYTKLVR